LACTAKAGAAGLRAAERPRKRSSRGGPACQMAACCASHRCCPSEACVRENAWGARFACPHRPGRGAWCRIVGAERSRWMAPRHPSPPAAPCRKGTAPVLMKAPRLNGVFLRAPRSSLETLPPDCTSPTRPGGRFKPAHHQRSLPPAVPAILFSLGRTGREEPVCNLSHQLRPLLPPLGTWFSRAVALQSFMPQPVEGPRSGGGSSGPAPWPRARAHGAAAARLCAGLRKPMMMQARCLLAN